MSNLVSPRTDREREKEKSGYTKALSACQLLHDDNNDDDFFALPCLASTIIIYIHFISYHRASNNAAV